MPCFLHSQTQTSEIEIHLPVIATPIFFFSLEASFPLQLKNPKLRFSLFLSWISESMDGVAQFKLALLLFFTSFVLLPSIQAKAKDVKYCDKKGNYAVKVQGIEISPDPVVTGKPATFNISASTGETISGGKLIIEVSYFGVRVHTENHDLCEESSCPISVGNFVLSHAQTLPGFTPPVFHMTDSTSFIQGKYTLKMKMEDENGHQLTCITFNFNIGFRSLVSDN
ncbi:hypothetical protein L1049_012683 [Liquidambar formosana]|uniref:MD-2-related lipid-recognition domain-containing protein n=1 Tax=Liquidambar formosana TaxID=63359 RepID=A0AAP0WWT6_LIQFO